MMESFGLSLLVIDVFPKYDVVINLLIMNTVFFFPSLNGVICSIRNLHRAGKKDLVFSSLIFVLVTVGLGIVLYISWDNLAGDKTVFWHCPVSIFMISLSWSSSVQKMMGGDSRQRSSGSIEYGVGSKAEDEEKGTKVLWKLLLVSSTVKGISTILSCFLLFYLQTNVSIDDFTEGWTWSWSGDLDYFIMNIGCTVLGYFVVFYIFHVRMQWFSFLVPMSTAMAIFMVLLWVDKTCEYIISVGMDSCHAGFGPISLIAVAGACLFVGQVLFTVWILFRSRLEVLQNETQIFSLPTFNGVLLKQWLLLDHRAGHTNYHRDDFPEGISPRKVKVFICTTMYRETNSEMQQLLESLNAIKEAKEGSNFMMKDGGEIKFESHILVDAGINAHSVKKFARQLLSQIESTLGLGITDGDCLKTKTPYGMKLRWEMIPDMTLNVHLKDASKVKRKKRWSQVMYMSYVLDFYKPAEDEECFILTTDGDVTFFPNAVKALLDGIMRDLSVGAICARTYPVGNGPLVWFQMFEYAIGYWFQKATEHVLGSVLCAPGCFSIYRCEALKDVLPRYSTGVERAMDFLIKDMGEDRWLCTLLIQKGWSIEYCAAAGNSTFCPSSFSEFFKQRRRWIVSTIANMMTLIKDWELVSYFNHRISVLYLLYQGVLLFSAMISPGVIILIVTGGFVYVFGITNVLVASSFAVVQVVVVGLVYGFMCINAHGKSQIFFAQVLIVIYGFVMAVLVAGTGYQIWHDKYGHRYYNTNGEINLSLSITTFYLISIAGIFVVGGILHLKQCIYLLQGVWYLLCLPGAYLVLVIYGVCNITDQSWGTREESTSVDPRWSCLNAVLSIGPRVSRGCNALVMLCKKRVPKPEIEVLHGDDDAHPPIDPLVDFLGELSSQYIEMFKKNGFDDLTFIAGMSRSDLEKIGVTTPSDMSKIMLSIQSLPPFEVEDKIPDSVEDWLKNIGLEKYLNYFKTASIRSPEDLSILITFDEEDMASVLNMTTMGHVRRLKYAISKLPFPSKADEKAVYIARKVEGVTSGDLKTAEKSFWEDLIKVSLCPEKAEKRIEDKLRENLEKLRNSWLLALFVSNVSWIALILVLAPGAALTVLHYTNPMGIVIIVLFGLVFFIQFVCMVIHRILTLTRYLTRDCFITDSSSLFQMVEASSTRLNVQWNGSSSNDETTPLIIAM